MSELAEETVESLRTSVRAAADLNLVASEQLHRVSGGLPIHTDWLPAQAGKPHSARVIHRQLRMMS